MSTKINIGIGIDLQSLLDTRLLIQAGSGGGKSYALRKVIESVGNGVQQIILDPEGEFVTLREKFNFALVGKGGDIPLNLKYAETLAHKLLETNLSAIIDLYELKYHERILFVKRFLDALINSPKQLWHSCLIYVDEANIFCPESSKSESGSSVIDLCTRGRKRGFAAILATQRLSKLNKNASAELLNKMIGRTGQDIDRKRSGDELGMMNKADLISLRELKPGEFYAFGPAISNEVTKFTVSKVQTTHLRAGKRITKAPPTPNAVKKILNKLADIPEEAEKELQTKKQLQQEITRLKSEITKLKHSSKYETKTDDSKLSKRIAQLEKENEALYKNENDYISKMMELEKAMQKISELSNTKTLKFKRVNKSTKLPLPKDYIVADKVKIVKPIKKSFESNGSLPLGEHKILTACAQYPEGARRNQLTVLTTYKRSSRDAYISRLKEKGLLTQNGDRLAATSEGIGILGHDFEPLPTGVELQAYWSEILPVGEKAILERLITAYPDSVTREELTNKTGYMRSSRDAYISRMIAKEIVVAVGRGEVKASENLFNA